MTDQPRNHDELYNHTVTGAEYFPRCHQCGEPVEWRAETDDWHHIGPPPPAHAVTAADSNRNTL